MTHPRFYTAYSKALTGAANAVSTTPPGERIARRAWQIHQVIETESERAGTGLACKQGCSSCCSLPVTAYKDEARIAGEFAVRVYSPQMLDQITKALKAIKKLMADAAKCPPEFEKTYGISGRICPFLRMDKTCGIYEARPLFCRTRQSTRKATCDAKRMALLSGELPPTVAEEPLLSAKYNALDGAYRDTYVYEVRQRHPISTDWADRYFAPQVLLEIQRQRLLARK